MKKFLLQLIALVVSVLVWNGVSAQSLPGGINTGGGNVPFGTNTQYKYGIMPKNLPTGGTYGGSQKAADAYIQWKENFVVACGSNYRVRFDGSGNSTVSEGIGYGMLLAVYADDKKLFDGLWGYYKANVNGNGVMNWKIAGCGGVEGSGGATDAEFDAAMALVIACEQWGTSYQTDAKNLIKAIKRTEMASNGQALNGDGWGDQSTCRNPGYHSPAYYVEYAKIDTDNASFWNTTAVKGASDLIIANRNSTSGLVSNWSDNNGNENACGNTGSGANGYGADACRSPWRMAVDYLWHGSNQCAAAADLNAKLSKFIKGYESQMKGPHANRGVSNPSGGSYVNGSYTCFALPPMTQTDQSSLNACYTTVANMGFEGSGAYFNTTIRCITLFVLTGNFWAPGASGFSFPPTITQARTNSEGNKITLSMSTSLKTGSASASGFTVSYNGSAQSGAVASVSVNNDKSITLDIASGKEPVPGQTITVSYSGTDVQSADGEKMKSFTGQEVLNMLAGNETILDDCEDGNEFNNVGGIWFTYNDEPDQNAAYKKGEVATIDPLTGGGNPMSMSAPGYDGSAYTVKASFKLGKPYTPYEGNSAATWTNPSYVGIGTYVNADQVSYMDWSKGSGVTFMYKGPKCMFQFVTKDVVDAGDYGFFATEVPACNDWTLIEIKWADLSRPGWANTPKPIPFTIDGTAANVQKLQWAFETGSTGDPGFSGSFYIDEVHVLGMPPVALSALAIQEVSNTALAKEHCANNINPEEIPIASGKTGDTLYLETAATPANATYPVVMWSSSNEDVVTVDYKGRVIGVGYGEAIITARSKMHQSITATYEVEVPAPSILPTAIAFEQESYEIEVGGTVTLNPIFTPDNTNEKKLGWNSDNPTIAAVYEGGVVEGIAPGTVTITATSDKAPSVKKAVSVTVKAITPESISVDKESLELTLGESGEIAASVLPAAAAQGLAVSVTSGDDVVSATVSGGTVSISTLKVGTAEVTISSTEDNTITKVIPVTVNAVAVQSVAISDAKTSLTVGENLALSAVVTPATAEQTVSWESSDANIATVSAAGLVTALAPGEVTIKAISTADNTKFDTHTITVTAVPVASITLTPASVTLEVGGIQGLVPQVLPATAGNKEVTWSSSDDNVATVAADGTVTAVAKGTATITATAKDGSDVKGTCEVTVNNVMPTSITMATELGFTIGDVAKALTPTVLPENATVKTVTWSTSDDKVATVDENGNVTPVGEGECTITATSTEVASVKAECVVKVSTGVVNVTKVELDATATVGVNKTVKLTAIVLPEDATDKSVTWKSADETIATVDANGVVTGKVAGKTTIITVTTVDGGFTATCEVTVSATPVASVELSESTLAFTIGDAVQTLTATVLPEDATDKTVAWSTSDDKVATVVGGIVTPVGVGTCTITATANDGSGKTGTCAVTVSAKPVASVSVLPTELGLKVGGAASLTATVLPADATDKSVTWSSSDDNVATVAADGTVTGVAEGSATITVTTTDGSKIATCEVTVSANTIAVTGVRLSPETSTSVALNETITFIATVEPSTASNKAVEFTSTDETVATIDATGAVTLKKAGKTTITVTTVDGEFTATCELTVTDILVSKIILDGSLSLKIGASETISSTVMPEGASKELSWSSSDPTIATVDNTGKVTAMAAGTCEIAATATDGTNVVSNACKVTVSATAVETVALDIEAKIIRVGGKATLTATVTPENATNKNVVWSSSAEGVASVANGVVTGVAGGKAIITVKAEADAYKLATCAIEVVDASDLAAELAIANADHTVAVEGTAIGNYKVGSKATFATAIAAAQAVMDNENATQTQIDAALSELKAAERAFAKAVLANETLIFNADMEQENMTYMSTYWFSFNDSEPGGSSVVTPLSDDTNPFTMTAPGYNGVGKSAKMDFTLEGQDALDYNPFVGMGLNFNAKKATLPFDMTGSTGISFYIKNDVPVYLEIGTTMVTDACDFNYIISENANWELIELSWSDFAQYTWGKQVDWDLTQLVKAQWKVQAADGTTGSVWVDEVKILGVALDLPEILDKGLLYTAIAEAEALIEETTVGSADGNVPQSAATALNAAIASAQGVVESAEAQTEVDAAVSALNSAMDTFKAAIISVDRSPLQAVISQAETLLAGAVEGEEEGLYLAGSKAILSSAIADAEDVYFAESVSQADITAAVAELNAAIEVFEASIYVPGAVNKVALNTTIATATATLATAVEGLQKGNFPEGSKAVLQAALDAAKLVANDGDVKQEQVDAANSALATAIEVFNAQKITVDRSALQASITSATTLHSSAIEGPAKGNYPAGSKATLMTAINTANAVAQTAAASQMDIDNAKLALDNAVKEFKALVITVDKALLEAAIDKANQVYSEGMLNSGEGPGQYPAYAVSELGYAIENAQDVLANINDQSVINQTVFELNQAVSDFTKKKNKEQVSIDRLIELVAEADILLNSTYNPAKYITEYIDLTTAKNAARTETERTDHNERTVVTLETRLEIAIEKFKAAIEEFGTGEPTAIEDEEIAALQMYPNPCDDVLNVVAGKEIKSIVVMNVTGSAMFTTEVSEATAQIPVQNLMAGYYFVKITYADGSVEQQRIVKK